MDEAILSTFRHTFFDLLFFLDVVGCGSSWGEWFTPEGLSFAILMDQEALLLPVFKLEKHVLLLDAEADFSSSDVDSCLGSPQEWSPKNELDSEVVLYVHCHEIRKNEGVSHSHQDVLNYPFGILHC